ncbi:MAG: 3'-5' exonuclease [Bacteroidales bacterium]|nr:3'-5' exonuclease [Bacteroidales bacterium]MBQ6557578.1 3'-5' exonuclease [Bacteroidales bacterium]MBQ6821217.1 3'-5' exonuclease [Bacteroidales bacterium]MBR0029463.1 3'-5' exonuclease [Bacteroidales bacterium]MBR0082472.1 3'-5' exonuclease [Bacteroidales bacterium]
MELNLKRPLLFFDIESTGLDIPVNSIIELSFVKVFPGGEERIKTWKIKPWDYIGGCQRPIEPGASAVNGVTDDMLTDCPTFFELAEEIASWVKDSDLAGFNSQKFDLPMLAEEFERAAAAGKKLDVDLHQPRMVDVQNIFHAMEPRNLRAAYRFYCGGEDFENAHTAEADTVATYKVLKAQLDRYPEQLKNDIECLSSFVGRKYVDFSGHLIYNEAGEAVINFGKHKGKTARQVWRTEPSYFAWIQQGSFTLDTKKQFEKLEEQFKLERLAEKFKRN